MTKTLLLVALAAIVTAASACENSNSESINAVVSIVTTNNISEDWVRRIGGDRVEVLSLVPPGTDPHTFQPGARDMTRVADADVVFSIGLGLEKRWLTDMLNKDSANSTLMIALGDAIGPISKEGATTEVLDPHFWFDPLRVKLAISEIALTLTALDPPGTEIYRDNSITYLLELDELHAWAKATLNTVPADRRVLITSHDTLEYFALRYGYQIVGTIIPEITTGTEISAKDLTELIDVVNKQSVPAIFVENTTNDRMATRVAEEAGIVAISSIYTGSLSRHGEAADTYVNMMRSNVTTIAEALR
ncbi:uncharacterized protein METZ01_LOCUS188802 [marine metagenome]|uniref:ABC transporter substrate-binding protein n=1 Tax=marine metagenome TaxID=408172 RepID=A0A382DC12_9ZZZZ